MIFIDRARDIILYFLFVCWIKVCVRGREKEKEGACVSFFYLYLIASRPVSLALALPLSHAGFGSSQAAQKRYSQNSLHIKRLV